jgi:hypothetical protein
MSQRGAVLSAYRALLRAARELPTSNRKAWVKKRVREDFRAARGEQDPERVAFLLQFADVSLENVQSQVSTLKKGALFAPWSK